MGRCLSLDFAPIVGDMQALIHGENAIDAQDVGHILQLNGREEINGDI